MKQERIYTFLIRTGIVIVVLSCIIMLALIPRIMQALRTDRSIAILAWPTVLDSEFLTDFERDTGIKVYVRYVENNAELFAKIQATQGKDYDLIMPTDYMAQQLIRANLLKKIDRSQLTFWHSMHPMLLGHYHDLHNEYTIPYFWGVMGLGINTDYFPQLPQASWNLVFKKLPIKARVGVLDDIRDLILITAQYLFGSIDNLTSEKIETIKKVLKKQKKWIEMYTDERGSYLLLSKTCPVAITTSGDIAKVTRSYKNIRFMIPKEGGFMVIDSFAIPIGSNKEQYIYQFLNYLYSPPVLKKYIDKFGFLSPVDTVAIPPIHQEFFDAVISKSYLLDFFRNVISDEIINDVLISLKA